MVDLIHLAGKHILITLDSTIEIYSPARILDINTIDDMTGNKVNFKLSCCCMLDREIQVLGL